MAAHRYWRLRARRATTDSVYLIAELEMRASNGGADETGNVGGTSFGSPGHFSGAEGPDKAFNNNTGDWHQPTCECDQFTDADAITGWDFGSGNDKDIVEVALTVHASFPTRCPSLFAIEYSDDNATWFTLFWVTKETWSGAGPHVFSLSQTTADNDANYWCALDIETDADGAALGCREIDWFEGGANITSGGSPVSMPSLSGFPNTNAYDNNTSTLWQGANGLVKGKWIGYDFGTAVTVDELRWTARNDGFHSQSAISGKVCYSDDGIVWLESWTFNDPTAYTSGETRTFLAPPTAPDITSITPNTGSAAGGTAVTISGILFTGATSVEFDGVPATSFVLVNATTITCVTPAGTVGTADVEVIGTVGPDPVETAGFTYLSAPAPTITSLTPDEGPATGGTAVTITGTDFTGSTSVEFGGAAATSFVVVNSTTITCVTPAGSPGLVDVEVLHPSGNDTLVDGFEFINSARVTQIPLLVIHKPVQDIRLTQIPLLVISLPIQVAKITQLPLLPIWTPNPIPLPVPVVPEVPVREVWEWKTVVNIFEMSKEQRSALRDDPRMHMQFDAHVLDDTEYRNAYEMMLKYISQVFNYPMYVYSSQLTAAASAGATKLFFDPAQTDVREGEVAAVYDKYLESTTFITITTVDADGANLSEPLAEDIPAYAFISPAPAFRVEMPKLDMSSVSGSFTLSLIGAQTREVMRPDQSDDVTMLDGLMLLDDRPLDTDPKLFNQNVEWLDNAIADPTPRTNWFAPLISGERRYLIHRPFGFDYWRAVGEYLKGRQKSFLMPSFRNDLPVITEPALSATSFMSDSIQFFDIWRSRAWKYVRIQSDAGVIYRTIAEVLANYDGDGQPVSITVKLVGNIGAAAGSNTNMFVSFVNTYRLDSDEIVLDHGEVDTVLSMKVRMVEA